MKCLHVLSVAAVATLGSFIAASTPAFCAAAKPVAPPALADAHTNYSVAQFQGQWALMSNMGTINVMANKALGPAARLLVALPEDLKKIVGQDRFSLARVSGTAWQGAEGDLTATLTLISENSAQLHITGKRGHKLDLPLYRND